MTQMFVAPVSREVLESAIIARVDGLLCSTSQVPREGKGYGGIDYSMLPHGSMIIERDHLKIHEMPDWRDWMRTDKDNGFTSVMIHTSTVGGHTEEAIDLARDLGLQVQLGPGEDDRYPVNREGILEANTEWVSWPYGTWVENVSNRNKLSAVRGDRPFRAHNADYLPFELLHAVSKFADGVNFAPQYATVQTQMYLMFATAMGLPTTEWVAACNDDDKNAARWCPNRPDLRILACGHYHYDLIEWRDTVEGEVVRMLTNSIITMKDILNVD